MRDDGSAIFPEGEEWWLTELEQRKAPEPQLDLAGDNIAEDDFAVNPSEVGSATDDSDTDGGDSTATDEGLPLIPRVRRRLSAYTVSAARKNEHGTAMNGGHRDSRSTKETTTEEDVHWRSPPEPGRTAR